MLDPRQLAANDPAWTICREVARAHGRSFFLASRIMRPEARRATHSAYAFCRIADDIVDCGTADVAHTIRALDGWEAQISRPEHPVAIAFAQSRDRYSIPDNPVHELFDGMRADIRAERYQNWSELRNYCYQAAGTVGLIVAPILGCQDPGALPRAAELGIAMQLTNILRDVGEDGRMGRVYLPLDELERFGVTPEHLLAGQYTPGFNDLMRFQVERARSLYADALTGVSALSPTGRLTTLLAAKLYAGILDEIEQFDFDVLRRRAVVPRATKGRFAAAALVQFVSMQHGRQPARGSTMGPLTPIPHPDAEGGLP